MSDNFRAAAIFTTYGIDFCSKGNVPVCEACKTKGILPRLIYEALEKIESGYIPPADACNTYRVAYTMLKEFEEDLHLHSSS